jgi:hypothetical protein
VDLGPSETLGVKQRVVQVRVAAAAAAAAQVGTPGDPGLMVLSLQRIFQVGQGAEVAWRE